MGGKPILGKRAFELGAFRGSSRWREKDVSRSSFWLHSNPLVRKISTVFVPLTTKVSGQHTILAKYCKNPIIPLPGQHIIAHLDAAQT